MTTPRPVPGDPRPYILPERTIDALDNGMRVSLIPTGEVPRATIRLVVRGGSVEEPDGRPWSSQIFARLLDQGTEHRSAEQLATDIAALGGQLSVGVDDETLTLRVRVLSQHVPEMLAILAEVIQQPLLPDSEVVRLRNDLLRQLAIASAEPSILTQAAFRRAVYGDHPFGDGLPTPEQVSALSGDDARAFYRHSVGAARAHLYIAGLFDAKAASDAVSSVFGAWQAGGEPSLEPASASSHRTVYTIDRPGAEQSTIYLGRPVPDPSHPDYVSLVVTDALLGGSFASRITQNIREEKGYTYSPRSQVASHYRSALWIEVADVTTNVTGLSLHEIFREIDLLRAETPDEAEVDGARKYVGGTFVIRGATPGGLIDRFEFIDFHGLGEEYAARYVDRVQAVTPEVVRRMAEEYLVPSDMTIAVAGDMSVIREQLEPYGPITEGVWQTTS